MALHNYTQGVASVRRSTYSIDSPICNALNRIYSRDQESCSATANYDPNSKQRDQGIDQGYTWLVRQIVRDWDTLSERVERESNEQIEIEKQIMKERFKRFRAKQEDQQQEELTPDARHHDPAANGNPFKPIKEVLNSVHYENSTSSPKATDPRSATGVHATSSPEKSSPTRRSRSAAAPTSKSPTKRNSHANRKHHTTSSANGRAHKVLIESSQDRDRTNGAKRNDHNFEMHDRVVDHTQSSPEKRTSPQFSDTRRSKTADHLTTNSAKSKKKRKSIFRSNKVTPLG